MIKATEVEVKSSNPEKYTMLYVSFQFKFFFVVTVESKYFFKFGKAFIILLMS